MTTLSVVSTCSNYILQGGSRVFLVQITLVIFLVAAQLTPGVFERMKRQREKEFFGYRNQERHSDLLPPAASRVFPADTQFRHPSILSAVNCLKNSKQFVGNSGSSAARKGIGFIFQPSSFLKRNSI